MKMREDVRERYGIEVPDDKVLWDTDDEFGYTGANGVVGWNRSTEIFWRNRVSGEPLGSKRPKEVLEDE